MKNNGMGKFEIFGIIVLVVAGFTFVVNYLLDNSESQRLVTMKKSTESFGRIVSMNRNFFHNRNEVYLGEVIDEGYINNIISPFSKKDCSPSESKVIFNQGNSNNDYTVILK